MTNVKETSCRLCLKNITNKSFEVINNIIRDILDGLLLKLKLDSGSKEVICSACRRKLNTALEFKSTCLNTNNTIIPYVDNEKMLRLDLREVYMQEKKSELVCSQKICRLCMHPIKSEFRCIREEELETIQKLTPEMNVNIIKDPVVCNPCFDTLCTHNSFLKDCLEVEEKINSIFDSSATETQIDKSPLDLFIKTEDLDKEFDINEMGMSIKAECVDIKSEDEEGRLDPYGLTGQWLTDSLNDCVFTYDIAPVFTLMENHVMQEVCRMIGPDWGDGLFCPGGSYGNGTAINLARFERYPDVKKKGSNHIPRQAIFASEECHYSVYKYASFLGIGEDNVFSIRTNDMGEMIVEDLEKKIEQQIEEGAVPLVVVATFGTTVKGAFDPINQIADVSKKHSMWLHIDAAWGGSLIFSQKHRSKLNGIERANSVVINVHKLLAVPQQCSMLLIRDKGILHKCFSRGAEYLFQKDKHYDKTYDVGDKYLQCGRKCDVFKFWFMWKAKNDTQSQDTLDIQDTQKTQNTQDTQDDIQIVDTQDTQTQGIPQDMPQDMLASTSAHDDIMVLSSRNITSQTLESETQVNKGKKRQPPNKLTNDNNKTKKSKATPNNVTPSTNANIYKALEKLDEISSRAHASLANQNREDHLDHFGKYIVSMLRNVSPRKSLSLQ